MEDLQAIQESWPLTYISTLRIFQTNCGPVSMPDLVGVDFIDFCFSFTVFLAACHLTFIIHKMDTWPGSIREEVLPVSFLSAFLSDLVSFSNF